MAQYQLVVAIEVLDDNGDPVADFLDSDIVGPITSEQRARSLMLITTQALERTIAQLEEA